MKGNGRQVLVRLTLLVVLLLAGAWFVARGPGRALDKEDDLAVFYAGARVWLHGHDPYNHQALVVEFAGARGASMAMAQAVSPPSTFVLLAPLGLFNWPAAKVIWLLVNLLSLGLVYLGLLRLVQPHVQGGGASAQGVFLPADDIGENLTSHAGWFAGKVSDRAMLLAVAVLGLAPVGTSIYLGQLTVPVTALVVWGIVAARGGRGPEFLAGALLAIAAGLKPQMGAAYLAYLLLRGRWRPVLGAAVVGSVLIGAGIFRMEMAGVEWLASLRANYAAFLSGGLGDLAGPYRDQLLQLQYPLLMLTGSRMAASVITWGVTVILGGVLVWRSRRIRTEKQELLAMGVVTTLGLLCVYHRYYDAAILLIPAAWALALHPPQIKPYAGLCLVLLVPFALPGGPMLHAVGAYLSVWAEGSWWWQGIMVPFQTWLTVGLAVVLTAALVRTTRLPQEQQGG